MHLPQKGRKDVGERLYKVGVENCCISKITKAELLYGAYKESNFEREMEIINKFISLFQVLPISEAISTYAQQKARLRKAGTQIEDLDLFIGSTAIAYNLVMVTENVKHFEVQKGIEIENWVKR